MPELAPVALPASAEIWPAAAVLPIAQVPALALKPIGQPNAVLVVEAAPVAGSIARRVNVVRSGVVEKPDALSEYVTLKDGTPPAAAIVPALMAIRSEAQPPAAGQAALPASRVLAVGGVLSTPKTPFANTPELIVFAALARSTQRE